jgi:hypothetical protein
MRQVEHGVRELLDEGLRAHLEHERLWWRNDRRGRWVVLEPGPGRRLDGAPLHLREYADAIAERRGRRFSSLSRARAFARAVDGEVRRWRRCLSRRYMGRNVEIAWQIETNPWARVVRVASALPYLGGL